MEGFVSRTSSSSIIAMPKSTTPKTTTPGGDTRRFLLLLLHPRDNTNRQFGKQQQEQLGVAVLRLASNNKSEDVVDDVNKGDAVDAVQQSQEANNSNDNDNDNTTTHQDDVVVDVVTSTFDSTTGETTETTPISSTLQQDKNAIDPIIAVVAVTAGLVGSFVVLYFELQQARLL